MSNNNEHPLTAMPMNQMSRGQSVLMAVAVGLLVGNLYYIQPLLGEIARSLQLSEAEVGFAATLAMVGQAVGMFLVLPMGDIYDRRPLVLFSVIASMLALLGLSAATGLASLAAACLLLGLATTGTHMMISLAASLARPEQRGRAVGTVLSGLLIGLLLSRTVSGILGAHISWRAIYLLAAGVLLLLFVVLWKKLPHSQPISRMPYKRLLASMLDLWRAEPALRESCCFGALSFGAFGAFWIALAFHLEAAPFHYGPQAAGLMGLLAVIGAVGASAVGRLADRISPRQLSGAFLIVGLLSFILLWLMGTSLLGMCVGLILMDLGTQGVHVCNQARVYGLQPEARNRLGTVYIVTYFAGGAIGSALGTWGWAQAGWTGVCAAGGLLMALALAVYVRGVLTAPALRFTRIPLADPISADRSWAR